MAANAAADRQAPGAAAECLLISEPCAKGREAENQCTMVCALETSRPTPRDILFQRRPHLLILLKSSTNGGAHMMSLWGTFLFKSPNYVDICLFFYVCGHVFLCPCGSQK